MNPNQERRYIVFSVVFFYQYNSNFVVFSPFFLFSFFFCSFLQIGEILSPLNKFLQEWGSREKKCRAYSLPSMVEMAFFLTPYYFSGFLTSIGGLSSLKEALKAVHKAITLATCLQTPKEKRQERPFVLTIALSGQDSGRAIPICRRRWTRQWPWRCFMLPFGRAIWIFFNWDFSRSQNDSNEKILLTNDITAELHCVATMWLGDALSR